MAREDTRWFVAGVVVMAIVLFLALPMSVLVVVDYMKMKSEMRYEIRKSEKLNKQVEKLKDELRKEIEDVANSRRNRSEPNQ